MFSKGQGVTQDFKEAVKWYRLSAEHGDAYGQGNLGAMYVNGEGVTKDYAEAYKWYYIAGVNGNEWGHENSSLIGKQMTPAQIAEAQKLAREWMEEHGEE